jgi:RNA polymerase sigma factor (sigma-70 family)
LKERADFGEYVSGMKGGPEAEQNEFLPTRRSLITRLKAWDDQEGWREFFNTYWRLIYSVALKAGCNDAEAQDVVQETILAVAKKMRGFHYDPAIGSFKNWLLVITRRRIADLRRRQPSLVGEEQAGEDRLPPEEPPGAGGLDLGRFWDEAWQRNLTEAAVQRVRDRVDAKQFQIFDCYVLRDWPVKAVMQALDVSAMQVYLAKHRIGGLIKKELAELEANYY